MSSQPLWTDFEFGTQNIGSVAGLAKACTIKQQEAINAPINEGLRAEWKTCLQELRGLQILEWDGPHSPGIISFACLEAKTAQFLQRAATTHSLSWKSFAHPSFPCNPSIRLSWLMNTLIPEYSSALSFFEII